MDNNTELNEIPITPGLDDNDNEFILLKRSRTEVLSKSEDNHLEQEIYSIIDQRAQLIDTLLKEHIELISKKYREIRESIVKHFGSLSTMRSSLSLYQKRNHMEDILTELKNFGKIEEIIRIGIDLSLSNFEQFMSSGDIKGHNQHDKKEEYVKKAILNEALLQKDLNFSDYNITFDNKQINEGIQDLIALSANRHNVTYTIKNIHHYEKDIKILYDNHETLTQLHFLRINDINKYFSSNTLSYPKLKVIQFEECSFDSIINLSTRNNKNFPSLTTLIYQDTCISLNTINSNLLPPLYLKGLIPSLQILKLDKANLTRNEFSAVFNAIMLNSTLIKSIKLLSFTHNQIRSFNYSQMLTLISPSKKIVFESLEELNLSYNQLFSFIISFQLFPKIQLINLVNNSFANKNELSFPQKKSNILLLTNRNMFLANQSNMTKYIKNLIRILPSFNYPIESMSLSGLFTKFTANSILDIPLNQDTLGHLQDLDLSYCGLNTDLIIQFMSYNNQMTKLRSLDLKYNFITIDFFEKYSLMINNTDVKRMSYLEKIDMSNNAIMNKDFKYMYEFISNHKGLKHVNLIMNPFGREYTVEKRKRDQSKIEKIPEGEENYSFYTVDKSLVKENNSEVIMTFNAMIGMIYDANTTIINRRIYIDFSTDSRVIIAFKLEKRNHIVLVKLKGKVDS